MSNYLTPKEILLFAQETGVRKVGMPKLSILILSFLAGVFIALASVGSNMIAHNIDDIGLAKYLAGLIFPAGLLLVVVAGAELFTGNNLISIALLSGKVKFREFISNLSMLWLGNLAGSIFVALLIYLSGQLDYSSGVLGAYTLKVGIIKTNLTFVNLFTSGILCNILVCLAVWMAYASKDIAGKALAVFFPIWLFIASGFEHSVANMYYLSSALLAKSNPDFVEIAVSKYGIDGESLMNLDLFGMFIGNLLPVTLGNLIGGALFVGAFYWWSLRK